MVHRLLEHYLENGKPADAEQLELDCKHSSEMEKLAADAERSSIKYKQVQFLQNRVGEEFDGMISGVTEWGIFVELDENHCEGMIRIRDLKDDYYTFDEENYCLVGRRFKRTLRLGDHLRIEIKGANLAKKQLDFAFVDYVDKEHEAPAKKEPSNKVEAPISTYKAEKLALTNKKNSKPNKQQKSKPKSSKDSTPKNNSFYDEWGFEV